MARVRAMGRALGATAGLAAGAVAAYAVSAGPDHGRELGRACLDRYCEEAGRMVVTANEAAHARVASVARALQVEGAHKWTFAVIQSESSRVVSLPGGHTVFFTGSLEVLPDSALASLVAREMALDECGHGLIARTLAVGYALTRQPVFLDAAQVLVPSASQLLRAECTAMDILADACRDPTDLAGHLPTLDAVAGYRRDDDRGAALQAHVPRVLERAAARLEDVAAGEESAAVSIVGPSTLSLLLVLLDKQDEASEAARALVRKATFALERLSSWERTRPIVSQRRALVAILHAGSSADETTAEHASKVIHNLAMADRRGALFGAAELAMIASMADGASGTPKEEPLRQAADLIARRQKAVREKAVERAVQRRTAEEAQRQAEDKLRQKLQEERKVSERRRWVVDRFGPLTRRTREKEGPTRTVPLQGAGKPAEPAVTTSRSSG